MPTSPLGSNDTLPGYILDKSDADKHLTALGGGKFVFVTFPDDRNGPPNHHWGTLDDVWPALEAENRHGRGVFVMVNESGGPGRVEGSQYGRKADDVVSIRCVWQEDDAGHGVPAVGITPTFSVVSSPGKAHRYYRCEPARVNEENERIFANIMQRMVSDHGCDKSAKDLPRILRLAGTYHQKVPGSPHLVRFEPGSGEVYELSRLAKVFPGVTKDEQSSRHDAGVPAGGDDGIRDIAEVMSALAFIDPDALEYADWLRVGMGLHALTGGSDEGLRLWDGWCQRGARYKEGECVARWSGFSESDGVTWGTAIWMAQDAGWNGEPLWGSAEERAAIEEQNRRMKRFYRDNYAVVVTEKGEEVWTLKERDGIWQWQKTKLALFVKAVEGDSLWFVSADGKKLERVSAVQAWANSPVRKTFQSSECHPVPWRFHDEVVRDPYSGAIQKRQLADAMLSGSSAGVLNTYQGLTVRPVDDDEACERIRHHVLKGFCDGSQVFYSWFTCWLGYLLWHPGELHETVPCFQSGQGTGKDMIIGMVVDWFGVHAARHASDASVTGRFTEDMDSLVLLFLDEAVFAGDKKHLGALKSRATDVKQRREHKFGAAGMALNRVSMIRASNLDHSAAMDLDGRRDVMMPIIDYKKGDRGYYGALKREIDSGGSAAFMGHCARAYAEKIEQEPEWHPRVMPRGVSAQAAQNIVATIEATDSAVAFVLHLLVEAVNHPDGMITVRDSEYGREFEHHWQWPADEYLELGKDQLFRAYGNWWKERPAGYRGHMLHKSEFMKRVKNLLGLFPRDLDVRRKVKDSLTNKERVVMGIRFPSCRTAIKRVAENGPEGFDVALEQYIKGESKGLVFEVNPDP